MGKTVWTHDACIEEAKKYKSRTEFFKKNQTAYRVALENGWLDECDWLGVPKKPKGYWEDYDNCKKEAQKYEYFIDFKTANPAAYKVALNNDWLKTFTWMKHKKTEKGFWTEERCRTAAMKYTSRGEFFHKDRNAYNAALRHGYMDDYTWFKPLKGKLNYDSCFIEA